MSDLQPGFNEYMDDTVYHGDREYVSSSALKDVLFDLRKYYNRYVKGEFDPEEANQPQFVEGRYVHSLILEPHKVEDAFITYDGVKRGKVWEEFKAANSDKEIIGNILESKGKRYIESFKNNKDAFELIKDGEAEKSACAILDGVKVKIRADYLRNDMIVDLKTTKSSLEVRQIAKSCAKYHYDLSAALYVDVIQKITGVEVPFMLIFIDKNTFDVAVFKASQQMIENGRRKYKAALKKLKQYRETPITDEAGIWVDNASKEIFLPDYAIFEG